MDHNGARQWLLEFLRIRLAEFGTYEDAIVAGEHFLHHSVISPLLNTGLLTPQEVIDDTLIFISEHEIPLNSSEGFIRQIIGWREFIRGIYEVAGRKERTMNFWKFEREIPKEF